MPSNMATRYGELDVRRAHLSTYAVSFGRNGTTSRQLDSAAEGAKMHETLVCIASKVAALSFGRV